MITENRQDILQIVFFLRLGNLIRLLNVLEYMYKKIVVLSLLVCLFQKVDGSNAFLSYDESMQKHQNDQKFTVIEDCIENGRACALEFALKELDEQEGRAVVVEQIRELVLGIRVTSARIQVVLNNYVGLTDKESAGTVG